MLFMKITSRQRSFLSKLAHDLHPYVMIGGGGVTAPVIRAVNEALSSHELIKVKFQDHKAVRKQLAPDIAERTGAELVRLIGNVAVLYRPAEDFEKRKITLP